LAICLKVKSALGVEMIEIKKIEDLLPKKKRDQPRRLLTVFAHPDDESLNLAGLLAKSAQEGIKTYLVCLTDGEKGVIDTKLKGSKLKKKRIRELLRASKILGVGKVFFCHLPDGRLYYQQQKLKNFLKEIITQVKPGVVITHDPSGGSTHPDHIATSLTLKSLLSNYPSDEINLYFVVLGEVLKETMREIKKQKINWQMMPEPTHWLNIASFTSIKEKACLVYQSQKLAQARPVSLKVWYQLFDREYLHLVDLRKKYPFRFGKFEVNYFKFKPPSQKTILA